MEDMQEEVKNFLGGKSLKLNDRELLIRIEFVLSDDMKTTENEILENLKIFKSFLLENKGNIITFLMSDDLKEVKSGYKLLIDMCLIHNINLYISIYLLGEAFSFFEIYLLEQEKKDIKNYKFKYNDFGVSSDFYSVGKVIENIDNFFVRLFEDKEAVENTRKEAFKKTPNSIKQEAIEESFKMIQEKLKNMKLGKYKDIDLTKYLKNNIQNINDSSEFEVHKDYMNEIFKNPQITSRLYKKDKPHFMNKLSNDNLAYCKDTDSFYFKGLEESLSIAYTDKYLLINIDKKQAIKGLNEALKGLEILTNDEVEKQKTFIKELINLINNTNTSYYTFKVIGKALGMNKNEARNYCKSILSRDLRSINKITFDKYYDE
ncbi:hypothetical protein N5T96_10415 [Aliarcobacter butzleri]|uniref:hypothetical protein n=1 Tax=Aliarcobacter butzleri TaxID=28197 RepID=UPI0021B61664|nr:hypothetical protein [Aliarcobacter butzleri]MCT7566744.1 hypothetical protein [Aliarcobacter butzleri]